ncbi:MAG: GAF domain-containing protein [Nitrospirae bacterium]|nr:GAF domain-containing protein [Nitrospirota bacterium]
MADQADLYRDKFAIFQEISAAIVAMDNVRSIAKLLVDIAINYAHAEKGSLMLLNEKQELFILAARDIDNQFISTYRAKIGEGIAGTVAQNRVPVLVEDIDKDSRFKGRKKDRYRTRSFISCPIMSRNALLGVLNINDKKDGTSFTEDEFDLMKVIANQAAIALENVFLMNQLKLKAADLEEINRKLTDGDMAKTDFLTRVSHELRTPLNSIKGAVYYLQQSEPVDRDARKEFYRIIADETGNVISVMESLIDFIRLEDEIKVLSRTSLNIPALLREWSESREIRDTLAQKKIALELDADIDSADIVGDKLKISQLFSNLIKGLGRHMRAGDRIRISVHDNEFLEVQIDLSREMPDEVLNYLLTSKKGFDPEQPEEMVRLYLARKAAEVHHWGLGIRNTGDGCSLRIIIRKDIDQKVDTVIKMTLDMFVEFLSDILDIDRCSIMLADNLTGDLTIRSSLGLSDDVISRTRIRPGDKIAGWVALEGKPLLIEDIDNDPYFGKKNIPKYTSSSFISLPLKLKDRVVGVVNLNNKKNAAEFTRKDLHIASLISDRISHFIEKFTSHGYSDADFRRFLKSFDGLIGAEKKYHKKHAFLADLIMSMLDELGAPEDIKRVAPYIAMVYDFGLMLIDEDVLKKKSLSPSEARSLRFHPHNTVYLLDGLEFSDVIKRAILHHHERYDGAGYPDGLKGDAIPLLSRVIAVADSFFAMTMDRPYRKKLPPDKALEEIDEGAGSLYDPRVTAALMKIVRKV